MDKATVIEVVRSMLSEQKNTESLYAVMKQMAEMSGEERYDTGLPGRKHIEDVYDKKRAVKETLGYLW